MTNYSFVCSDSVPSGTSLKKDYTLYPLLAHNKDRRGLALDGRLKHEDTNLASSSMWDTPRHSDDNSPLLIETKCVELSLCVCLRVKQEVLKEVQGMLVSYKVVVRMIASGWVWTTLQAGSYIYINISYHHR